MEEKTISNNRIKSLNWGMHDAIIDGQIVRDIPSRMIFVNAQSELVNFADALPGTMAATYGFGQMWQMKPDGTWATIA